MTLDGLLRAEGFALLLETARCLGLVVSAPLAWSVAPDRVRAALVVALAVVAHGQGGAPDPARGVVACGVDVVSELGLGLCMGLVVRIGVSVSELVGEQLAPAMGLGVAQLFDPRTHVQSSALSTIFRHLAVLIALVSGAHRWVIGALLASFHEVPLGSADPVASLPELLDLFARAVASGVRIALPVLAILFLVQVALAFVSRAAPAMQIFSVGFAVTLIVGGVVIVTALPDMSRELARLSAGWGREIETVLAAARSAP